MQFEIVTDIWSAKWLGMWNDEGTQVDCRDRLHGWPSDQGPFETNSLKPVPRMVYGLQVWGRIVARMPVNGVNPPKPSPEGIFGEIKKTSLEALEQLSGHKDELLAEWQRKLRALSWPEQELELFASMDFSAPAKWLRTFRSFQAKTLHFGEELARRGAPIDRALLAQDLLFEVCLHDLHGESALAEAVARLHMLSAVMIGAGFSRRWERLRRKLIARLEEVEQRLHGASAYVTQVYEHERRRLSHDLHDDVGHDLILLKLYLEVMAIDAKSAKLQNAVPRLEEALAVVSHTIESVRRLVLDLGPAIFDELGFLPALKYYAKQFSSRTGIQVAVEDRNAPENIPVTHQVALYRLLQGALSNVLKHAKASHVQVTLECGKNTGLNMTIEDDGIGFDTTAPLRRSFGLTAMRERVSVLGGKIQIESYRQGHLGERHGTIIRIELPLPTTLPQ